MPKSIGVWTGSRRVSMGFVTRRSASAWVFQPTTAVPPASASATAPATMLRHLIDLRLCDGQAPDVRSPEGCHHGGLFAGQDQRERLEDPREGGLVEARSGRAARWSTARAAWQAR